MIDLRQSNPIQDSIIVCIVVPDEAPETVAPEIVASKIPVPEVAAPQVLTTACKDSDTNIDESQLNGRLGESMVEVHDTKWYKDDLIASLNINGAILTRNFGIRTPIGELLTRNSDRMKKY